MAADRFHRRGAIATLAAALLAAAPVPGAPAGPVPGPERDPAPPIDKPASVSKRTAPTHEWFDGTTRRALTLDAALRADFSPKAASSGPGGVLRAADGPLKDVSPVLQSPVLRDEGGRARALPGGVLLVMRADADPVTDRDLLARHGASDARRVADRIWLLPSPAGLDSLALANRLAATGEFASAQPNWWVERARK